MLIVLALSEKLLQRARLPPATYNYVLLACKAYLDKDYPRVIRFADSAIAEKYLAADYEPEATRFISAAYRGVSLLHTS